MSKQQFVPSLQISEFTRVASVTVAEGGLRYTTDVDRLAQARLDLIKPGMQMHYSLSVETADPVDMVLRVGDHISTSGGRIHIIEGTITTDTAVPIDLSGAQIGVLRCSFAYVVDELPGLRPADCLSLQARFPLQDSSALRWNTSRWNSSYWNLSYRTDGLVWDYGRWTLSRYGGATELEVWQDITDPCTQIDVSRGVGAEGPAYLAQVGTLTAVATNALAPRETGMKQGTPVRLVHWPTRTVLFTGEVTDLEMTPYKPGGHIRYRTVITASDVIAQMASTTRYGARGGGNLGAELWHERLQRLMGGYAYLLNYKRPQASVPNPWVPGIVWETNLAKHIDALCCSVRGAWHVTANGEINVHTQLPTTPVLVFTDDSDLHREGTPPIMWYTDLDGGWRATDVVGKVTLENHACKVEDGRWLANDSTASYEDPTGKRVWGGTEIRIPTTLQPNELQALARSYLTTRARDWVPSSITLRPRTRADLSRCAKMESLSPVTVEYSGDAYPARITRVTHRLTPTEWVTKLELAPR